MGTHTSMNLLLPSLLSLSVLVQSRRHLCDNGVLPVCANGQRALYNRPTGDNKVNLNPVCSDGSSPTCEDGSVPNQGSTRVPDGKKSVPMDLVWEDHLNHSVPAKFRDYLATMHNPDAQEVGLGVLSGSSGAPKLDYAPTGNVQGARLPKHTVLGTQRISTNHTEHLS